MLHCVNVATFSRQRMISVAACSLSDRSPRRNHVGIKTGLPRLDAPAAYVTVLRARPARITKIGVDHSTRLLDRAARDGGLNTEITSLDLEPRATLNGLSGVELICTPIQSAGSSVVPEMMAGDMLFVGSSHKWHPGSDVAFLFNEILTLLVRSCRVHFHDIFLPGGYPVH